MGANVQQNRIKRIMMVEDEQDILLVYKDYLERKGYSVIASAPTANEVVHDFEVYCPDLLIMDYRLPGSKNGIQAAEDILQRYPDARILLVTAFDYVKDDLKKHPFLKDKNVEVYIKPVQLSRLVEIISDLE